MDLSDRELLARTLQAEAGNQGPTGLLAAGSVIMNRANMPGYGDGVRGAILAPGQFSAWNSVTGYAGGEQGQNMETMRPGQDAYATADQLLSGEYQDPTGGATHYYNPSISNPAWGRDRAGGDWQQIGDHIFGFADAGRENSTRGAPQMAMQPTQPQGLLGQLGIQRRDPTAQGETALPFYQRSRFGNTMGNLAMAFNSLRQRPDDNIPRIVTGQRATREQDAANNRTVEWLSSQPGGERFAGLVDSVGAAAALQAYQAEVARTSQPPSAAEAQIARLVASGVPYERAVGIVDGRLVESRDPVTGEGNVLDLAQQFLNPEGAATPADAATPTAPAGQFDEYDRDTLQRSLGLGGAIRTAWNRANEGFGAELPRATVDEARGNLRSLSTRSMLGLTAEFPGRPSNLTREEIRGLTVQPDELFSGAGSAEQKAQNLFDFTNEAVTAAQAVLESRVSPAEKVQARAALEYLVPLQQDYQSLLSALGRDTSTPSAELDAALNRYLGAGQ